MEDDQPMVYCRHCHTLVTEDDSEARYDRYGIPAGIWHDKCWEEYGYEGFVFDPTYAGESLEEE